MRRIRWYVYDAPEYQFDKNKYKVNKQRGYKLAMPKKNDVVKITSVNNGYLVEPEYGDDVWIYEDIDDALKQARELLEESEEEKEK